MARRIAVIGGGVVGCSIAFHLADRGLGQVTLFERDGLGSGTTWHSAGNITWKPVADDDLPILYAYETIERLEQMGRQTTGWLTTGRLHLAQSSAAMENLAKFHDLAKESGGAQARGYDGRMLSPKEAATLHPLLSSESLVGAWLNPISGRSNPADLTAAYARAAQALGATVSEGCRVTELVAEGQTIKGVKVDGECIPFDQVIVACGLWSRGLLAPLGYAAAQWGCEHFYLIARPDPALARGTISFVCPDALLYGREEVGGLLFGLFDEGAKTFDPESLPDPFSFSLLPDDWDKVAPYVDDAIRLFPALATTPIDNFINGPESFTPDGNPLIGPVPGVEGLFICSGMNSHGVTLSAGAGHVVADLLAGSDTRFPIEIYAPDRFENRGIDVAWLAREVSDTPSRYYKQMNG